MKFICNSKLAKGKIKMVEKFKSLTSDAKTCANIFFCSIIPLVVDEANINRALVLIDVLQGFPD
ncbi:MAG: hypothetical protein Ct9H300mP21_05830 [Pseudomonadota bacterium]|nr:MAG: hypothetical protein Ct9H300mP21_05830 [Pseudomonadota bacterium]